MRCQSFSTFPTSFIFYYLSQALFEFFIVWVRCLVFDFLPCLCNVVIFVFCFVKINILINKVYQVIFLCIFYCYVVVVVVDPTPPTCCQQSPAPESCGSHQSLPPGGKERLHFVGIRPEVQARKGGW